jgi:hypothetical protein
MSKELKIGDVIQINKVDAITQEVWPHLVGSHVTVCSFAGNGQAQFADSSVPPEDCPYQRRDLDFIQIDEEYGWEFELVS